jgi:ABC-type polar amino acid transport system ATPase subunit
VADKVVFMFEGAILETGHPSAMFSEPRNDRTRQFLQSVL